jgi:hypothetical protein
VTMWTGSIRFGIEASNGFLWTRLWIYGSHKGQGIWPDDRLLASQERLCYMAVARS